MGYIKKTDKKKIVITGGLGFIFSHVTEHFLRKGYQVYVIDNLSAGSNHNLIKYFDAEYSGIEVYVRDMAQAKTSVLIRNIDPQYIVHAAAISDVDYSIQNPVLTMEQNNKATINAFEAAAMCKNLEKFLYVSTDEVYGECDHPKKEDEILFPKNPYALSKAFGSLCRLTYDNTYPQLKDKTCETRFCNVFGPRQDTRKIIPAIKHALISGTPLRLHNGGKGYRQFIHVDEIPPVIELLLHKGDRTYNVTGGEGCTVKDLIEMAESYTGKKVPIFEGNRQGMDMRYEMSSDRLRSIGWKPRTTFAKSFERYINS